MRFTVIGSGAIGGLVGAHLVRAGQEVLFCDKDPLQVAALNRDGLRVDGPVDPFHVAVRAVLPAELPETLDVVLLAVKRHDTTDAVRGLAARLAPDGIVLALQNGLPARALIDEVGPDRVVLGFVNIGADLVAPAVVHQGNVATFRIGERDGRRSSRVLALAAALPWAEPTEAILGYLWGKEAYGAMLVATALSDRTIAETFADPVHRPLLVALAKEVLAQAPVPPMPFDGFEPDDLEGSLGRLAAFNQASTKSRTGVYRDLAVHHRGTEVEALFDELTGPLTRHLTLLVGSIEKGERRCEPATLALLGAYEAAERLGRPLNAVVCLLPAPSRAADGPLLGLQVAVKDMVDVAGHPRGNGNPGDMAGPPRRSDAPLVTRLRGAAADVFALSTLLEYAAGAPHPDLGEALNPVAPGRTAGGSSGGSAALVGAGVCAAAVGTDTGGSIRVPASYCGVVGLKPSFGLLPVAGVEPLSPSCDHVGLIGRDVATVRRVLAAVTAPRRAAARAPTRLRLGVLRAQVDHPSVQPEVAAAVRAALAALTGAGHQLVDVDDDALAALHPLLEPIVLAEAWLEHGPRFRADPAHYGTPTAALLAAAAAVSPAVHDRARRERARLVPAALSLTDGLDALVGPTLPFVAPATTPAFDGPDGDLETLFLGALNLTGQPAVTLPCGRTPDGMPVGLQLVGVVGGDDQLLAVAETVESCLPAAAG